MKMLNFCVVGKESLAYFDNLNQFDRRPTF
jgi:hypothetical protein